MALNSAQYISQYEALCNSMRTGNGLTDAQFVTQYEAILKAYIMSGLVSVTVTGVATGGSTAPGSGSVS
jgi:hypothetical protein